MRRTILSVVTLVGATLALGACGSDDSGEAVPSDELVILGLDIRYDAEVYEAAPGPVTLRFDNVGLQPHNIVFEETAGAPVAGAIDVFDQPGASVTYELELEPGSFVFFCSVPGHRAAGMEAILDVG